MKYTVKRLVTVEVVTGRPDLPAGGDLQAAVPLKTQKQMVWVDIAEVDVEPRTTRRTVIKKALVMARITPGDEPLRLRVLDEESAAVFEPQPFQPAPEWRL
jgi:hypothetical protein